MKMDRRLILLSLLVLMSCIFHQGKGAPATQADGDAMLLDGDDIRSEALTVSEEDELDRQSRSSDDDSSDEFSGVSIENERSRVKRAAFNTSRFMWYQHIPYVMNFTDPARRLRLRKVMDQIEDHLCVNFHDVEDRIDKSDRHWPTKNGFETDAYIMFRTGKGCVSTYGKGSGKHVKYVSPCYSFHSLMHETMHALGALHTQKMPGREKYITVHWANIRASKRSQYNIAVPSRTNAVFFNPKSTLLYGQHYFSVGGKSLKTYEFIRPEMKHLYGGGNVASLYYELNENYKCREKYCSHVTTDCGQGYLTFVHDKCVCVCPDMFDPDTNCATLIAKVDGPASWPNTPFTLYKADVCPDTFQEGTIPIRGKTKAVQTGSPPLPSEGKTLKLEVCTKNTPTQDIRWDEWPLSTICVGKVKDVNCSFPLEESTFTIKKTLDNNLVGDVGDVTFKGQNLVMKYCCHNSKTSSQPMKLPTKTSFRLLKSVGGCQSVDGMFANENKITTGLNKKITGFKPSPYKRTGAYSPSMCLYIPPTYECSNVFRMTPSQKTVTFSIPKTGSIREGKRRCFYAFEAPPKSRLRLTFDKFSIHPKDKFFVKRFHPWTNPFRVESDSSPSQMITERNYLFIEFWSHHEESSEYTGADLKVDLLLDDELCYNAELQGSDYAGDKSVTELYEECLPWKAATTCPDFPWEHSMTLLNSGNKCRNLYGKEMLQPWCYIKANGSECHRRYCDVCDEADPIDVMKDCAARIQANTSACSGTEFKNNCFKSCDAREAPYDQHKVTCPKPELNSMSLVPLVDSYKVGSELKLSCGYRYDNIIAIECTTHGWTPFDCAEEFCMDLSQYCQKTLINFPEFCTHKKSRTIAEKYCRKSCSLCTT